MSNKTSIQYAYAIINQWPHLDPALVNSISTNGDLDGNISYETNEIGYMLLKTKHNKMCVYFNFPGADTGKFRAS